jgi:16S rRNA (adenine1518-N6/adenine1519-N6)-dimethyltransferase
MTLMFQKEVSQRIIATPGNKSFGRLSILAQWLCECDSVMELPPEAFSPPPKVSSSVVHFKPKIKDIDLKLFAKLEKLTAAAFGQRRKKIRSSLRNICDEQMLAAANISADLRAENLTVAQFINLARLI